MKRGTNQYQFKERFIKQSTYKTVCLLFCFIGVFAGFGYIEKHPESNKLLSPLAKPVQAKAHIPTKLEIIEQSKHGDILLRIWNNETSEGKAPTSDPTALHGYCRNLGKTNEFGYSPFNHMCFDTFKESVDTVNAWFDKCLSKNNLSACLEIYSGNSASYIAKFLSL